MTDYLPTRRVPARELCAGDIIDAQQIFAEWPSSSGLLSPLEADGCGPVDRLGHFAVGSVERYTQDGTACSDVSDIRISYGDGAFLVEYDQMIQLFEEG